MAHSVLRGKEQLNNLLIYEQNEYQLLVKDNGFNKHVSSFKDLEYGSQIPILPAVLEA